MMNDTEYLTDMEPGKKREYLTDAELSKLIAEVEPNELIPAAPDLQELILERLEAVEQEEKRLEEQRKCDRIREYKRYRFRVLTAVAAAVAVVFLLPGLEENVAQDKHFETFHEAKGELHIDGEIMEAIRGGVNIFANNNRWNLFRK